MSKEREKVKCKTKLEFITEVADDCVANLKDKDREHLIRNPYAIDYHFSYCLYIRNHYIHNRDRQRFGGTYDPSITIIYFKACGRATTRRG